MPGASEDFHMTATSRDIFFNLLRDEWGAFLRHAGFVGTEERFQRELGPVIHALAVQESKHGGSCCINLGVHLDFLPLTTGKPPQAGAHVRPESCEFQWRLTPPGFRDYWWAFEKGAAAHLPPPMLQEENAGPAERAQHLAGTFETQGEPAFQRLSTLQQIADLIKLQDLDNEWRIVPEYAFTPGRAGLSMARIHRQLGNHDLARRFAVAGLERVGKARAVHLELEMFLIDSSPARPAS
jgi:hypothetical protein